MKRFRNAVCIVTGGGAGIGQSICRHLGAAGALVIVADIQQQSAEAVAETIRLNGAYAEAVHLNVADEVAFERTILDTVDKHGRLDYLFNNAGVNVLGDFRDLSNDVWKRLVEVNLWGVIHGTRSAYRVMVRQGSGHIVNMASGLGLTPAPRNIPYATTKFAVVGLSESLRIEAADLGVHVSVVCPGWIRTPMVEHGQVVGGAAGQTIASVASIVPLGLADVDDVVRQILRGVARRKAVITVPRYVGLFKLLYHICRPLSDYWNLREIRAFRASQSAAIVIDKSATEQPAS